MEYVAFLALATLVTAAFLAGLRVGHARARGPASANALRRMSASEQVSHERERARMVEATSPFPLSASIAGERTRQAMVLLSAALNDRSAVGFGVSFRSRLVGAGALVLGEIEDLDERAGETPPYDWAPDLSNVLAFPDPTASRRRTS